jgi:hypothetical protein
MQITRRKLALFLATLAAIVLGITVASADDWTLTGTGMRVKTVVLVDVNVYEISHFMKGGLPEAGKSTADKKKAVIDADVPKKFVWTVKRDLPQDKVQAAIKDGFSMNGYTNQGKIDQYLAAFAGELKEGSKVTIEYDPGAKKVNVTTGVGKASVEGADFMKGVWSIWFGKIDPPSLGDKLVSKIP